VEDYTKKGPVTPGELRLAGMDLLARREHGSSELKSKLTKRFRQRDCDPDIVESVVQQLIDEGLLSDERFAASRARQLVSRGYGPSRIRNDLRQQKVDQYLSDSMSEAFDEGVDWDAEAASAYEKKYRGKPIEGDWDERQRERARRLRFLQYRGFGAEISRRLVDADDVGESPETEGL
jgi:regulatory protein